MCVTVGIWLDILWPIVTFAISHTLHFPMTLHRIAFSSFCVTVARVAAVAAFHSRIGLNVSQSPHINPAYEHGHRITSLLNWFIKNTTGYSFNWMNSEKFNLFTLRVEISGSIKSHFRIPWQLKYASFRVHSTNYQTHFSFDELLPWIHVLAIILNKFLILIKRSFSCHEQNKHLLTQSTTRKLRI